MILEDSKKFNMSRTFIIAEAGVNHNASIELALQLVDKAILSGADAIKFQTAIPEMVATNEARKALYQIKNTGQEETQLEMIRKILLPLPAFHRIDEYCRKKGIIFFSTAFDLFSLDFLEAIGQPYHKIPSGEITNLPYLRRIGTFGKPIFLSTGMACLGEIEAAIEVIEEAGSPRSSITVLHCTTEYPVPDNEVNLRAMQSIAQAFGVKVGYSDHSKGIEVAMAAVAMGAKVIEKHITTDKNLPGPDHLASLEPDMFTSMVRGIRTIEQAMGDGIKRATSSEKNNRLIVRKSLVASKPILAGELFSEKNLTAKRPGEGISPMLWDDWIGRPAARNFAADEVIR